MATHPHELDHRGHSIERFIERYMPSETSLGHAEAVLRAHLKRAVYVAPEDGTDQHFWDAPIDLVRLITLDDGQRIFCRGTLRLVVTTDGVVKTVLPLNAEKPAGRR